MKLVLHAVAALPADGIIDTGTGLADDIKKLLLAVAAALVVWIIVKAIWVSGGAIGATVLAVLVGGFMLWAVNNIDVLEGMFDDQFNAAPAAGRTHSSTVQAIAPPVPHQGGVTFRA